MRPKVEYKREAESKSGASRVTHRRAAINECKSSQFNLFYSWFDGLPHRNACCALISVLPRTTSTDAPVSMTPPPLERLLQHHYLLSPAHNNPNTTATATSTTYDHLPPSFSANKARAQLRDCVQGKEQAQMVSDKTPEGLCSPSS